MPWDTELRAVLKDYIEHESTITVVVAMYRGVRSMPRLFTGEPSPEDARDGGHALLEQLFVLPNSPFMGMFGPQMTAVYQAAANAYTDSFEYFGDAAPQTPESQADHLSKIQACRWAIHEVALMAVMCERGFGFYRQNSRAMRDRLYAMKDVT